MKDSDPASERLRVIVGLALIVGCGFFLWKDQLRPILSANHWNVWEVRGQVRDKVTEWIHESQAEERARKLKEELKKEELLKKERENLSEQGKANQ